MVRQARLEEWAARHDAGRDLSRRVAVRDRSGCRRKHASRMPRSTKAMNCASFDARSKAPPGFGLRESLGAFNFGCECLEVIAWSKVPAEPASYAGCDLTFNPNGIPAQSPGLRPSATLGWWRRNRSNPNGVAAIACPARPQPRWGCWVLARRSQGSAFCATLGWRPPSLWDWSEESAGTSLRSSESSRTPSRWRVAGRRLCTTTRRNAQERLLRIPPHTGAPQSLARCANERRLGIGARTARPRDSRWPQSADEPCALQFAEDSGGALKRRLPTCALHLTSHR